MGHSWRIVALSRIDAVSSRMKGPVKLPLYAAALASTITPAANTVTGKEDGAALGVGPTRTDCLLRACVPSCDKLRFPGDTFDALRRFMDSTTMW
jgi:hypothetical protein